MSRHKRSHYKSKSKLFLFNDDALTSHPIDEPQLETKPDVTIITIASISDCINAQTIVPDTMLSIEQPSLAIPASVEAHNLMEIAENAQVPHDVRPQEVQLSSFDMTTEPGIVCPTDVVKTSLDEDASLYVLVGQQNVTNDYVPFGSQCG